MWKKRFGVAAIYTEFVWALRGKKQNAMWLACKNHVTRISLEIREWTGQSSFKGALLVS